MPEHPSFQQVFETELDTQALSHSDRSQTSGFDTQAGRAG